MMTKSSFLCELSRCMPTACLFLISCFHCSCIQIFSYLLFCSWTHGLHAWDLTDTHISLWLKCKSVWETCSHEIGHYWHQDFLTSAAPLSRRTMFEPSSRQQCPPLRCQHAISLRLSASRHLWESCRRVPHHSLQTLVWMVSPGPSLRWPHFCRLLEPKGP